LKHANFRTPPGLSRWFNGLCTTQVSPETGIGVVQKPVSTWVNQVADDFRAKQQNRRAGMPILSRGYWVTTRDH
jgi:hypothetical protein